MVKLHVFANTICDKKLRTDFLKQVGRTFPKMNSNSDFVMDELINILNETQN